jgi:hypothetical protein
MSTRNLPVVKGRLTSDNWQLPPSVSRLSANVGASTSQKPRGLHGLLQGWLVLSLHFYYDFISLLFSSASFLCSFFPHIFIFSLFFTFLIHFSSSSISPYPSFLCEALQGFTQYTWANTTMAPVTPQACDRSSPQNSEAGGTVGCCRCRFLFWKSLVRVLAYKCADITSIGSGLRPWKSFPAHYCQSL